jgi:Na+/glutamate symporter
MHSCKFKIKINHHSKRVKLKSIQQQKNEATTNFLRRILSIIYICLIINQLLNSQFKNLKTTKKTLFILCLKKYVAYLLLTKGRVPCLFIEEK